jgi:hypothetical protein
MSITINQAQKRLAVLWGIGAAIAFLLLIWESVPAQVLNTQNASDAWHWLLPLIIPFLTLIASSVVAEAQRQNPSTAQTSDLAFGLAWWMSMFYLAALICSLLLLLWSAADNPIDTLKMANNWLTPIQLLLGTALGVFFTQRRRR